MTILYSNGCSFTANFNLERDHRYPVILANRAGVECHDRAEPGSCNSRIIRTTIRDCLELQDQKIIALIQLSYLHRTEYPTRENPLLDPFFSIKPNILENAPAEAQEYANLYWRLHDNQQILINLFTGLIGLTSFFKQQNIQYFIYLGPNENDYFKIDDIRLNFLKKDPRILDLQNFNMLDLTGKQAHPNEQGMQLIANYFFNLLCEQA